MTGKSGGACCGRTSKGGCVSSAVLAAATEHSDRTAVLRKRRAPARAPRQLLGKGGFAICYKTRCVESGREYALKVADGETLTRKLRDKLSIEIRIQRELAHASIVRLERFDALEGRARERDPRVDGDPARESKHADAAVPAMRGTAPLTAKATRRV